MVCLPCSYIIVKKVMCLHFSGVSVAFSNAYFGQYNGSMLLTGLTCTGSETSLLSCSHSNSVIGSTGCLHSNDAGVKCSHG